MSPEHRKGKCANEFKVGIGQKENSSVECERRCEMHEECKYYFWSTNNLCILYSKCNNYTKMTYFGTSFEKTGKTNNISKFDRSFNIY